MSVGLPNARRAAYFASSADRPSSRCSSASKSRSACSSRSRSAFLFVNGHHRISALLGGGPHHTRHSVGHLLPFRFFDHKLLSTFFGQAVILEVAVAVRCFLPL